MSLRVRIKNLPVKVSHDKIREFLSKATNVIESIIINDTYADVSLTTQDDLESVLMLSGQEFLGSLVKIQLNVSDAIISPQKNPHRSPQTSVENSPVLRPNFQEKNIQAKQQEEFKIDNKNNIKIENSLQLREILQEVSLKEQLDLPNNDYFYVVMEGKLVAFVTMITLILLIFSETI